MAPPPTARRGCDRPVGAGRSTALWAVLAPHQPRPGRQIVIKTGKPSADSRAKPVPKPGRQCSLIDRKVADCHRSPSFRHFRRWVPVGLSTYSLPTTRSVVMIHAGVRTLQITRFGLPAVEAGRWSAGRWREVSDPNLGQAAEMTASWPNPTIYLDPGYWAELQRRNAIQGNLPTWTPADSHNRPPTRCPRLGRPAERQQPFKFTGAGIRTQ
jgi:hypothetical protein